MAQRAYLQLGRKSIPSIVDRREILMRNGGKSSVSTLKKVCQTRSSKGWICRVRKHSPKVGERRNEERTSKR